MNYPTNMPDWRAELMAYAPAEDHAQAIYEAQAAASVVVASVTVFNALKTDQGLTQEGLRVLVGAAYLIAAGGWHGLAGEAAILIGQRALEIEPIPDSDPPEAAPNED